MWRDVDYILMQPKVPDSKAPDGNLRDGEAQAPASLGGVGETVP